MRYEYPVSISENDDGWTVTSPDLPELISCGSSWEEAMESAEDALVTALSFYVDEGQQIPHPSNGTSFSISVPALEASKLALHEVMLSDGVSNVELAKQLNVDEKVVRRLRDLLHRSHIAQVEAALRSLGRRVVVEVDEVRSDDPVNQQVRHVA